MLATGRAVTDSITITHVPDDPQLVDVEPGAELRWDLHETDHHITVIKGTCRVLGRRLGPGGSAYVPAGTDHAVKAGAWGCTFFSVKSATKS